MPFGGAGPLFGTLLARELDITEIIVPPYAGNFSAWGLLGADLTQTSARTKIMPLSDENLPSAGSVLEELFAQLEARADGRVGFAREIGLDMRYVGQEHSLTVAVPGDELVSTGVDEIRRAFASDYDRTFGHVMDEAVEIVSLRATIRNPLPRRAASAPAAPAETNGSYGGTTSTWSFTRGERLDFAIVDRASIDESGIEGPAIVLEETATTYLDADFRARAGEGGVLHLTDVKGA
jgi:N-methylhydantoinase A